MSRAVPPGEGVELTTNLAGVEIVAPLCLLLFLFIISTIALVRGKKSDQTRISISLLIKNSGFNIGQSNEMII
jgi:hypothetical protein